MHNQFHFKFMKKFIAIIILTLVILLIIVGCSQYNQSYEINIKSIKKILPDKSEVAAKGYLIFKTKNCSFKTVDRPRFSFPPVEPCGPNTGYVILSDIKVNKDWDPKTQKIVLTDEEILVYYVPDKIIDELNLNQVYQIHGIGSSYDEIEALKFISLIK